ncbi:MAG TPA: DUF47 family protein [Candidatus Korarchaeota archaeon]|nr:DUF47 family protein [Candidatus Korarchaeota archaeon]
MAKRYLDYFRKTAASSTLESIAELALKARDAAKELRRVIAQLESGALQGVEEGVSAIAAIEEEGDSMRRAILARLSKAEVSARDAEKLARLARRVDLIVDQIKNTALAIRTTVALGEKVPEELCKTLSEMTEKLAKETEAVVSAIRSAMISLDEAKSWIERVEALEHEIDLLYYEAKGELPSTGTPRFAILLNDVINEIELAADLCEDATDVLSELVVRLSLPGGAP